MTPEWGVGSVVIAVTPGAWESYESRIRQRSQTLTDAAPFLFGHGQTYTVEETYPTAWRVRVGGESRLVLLREGQAVLPTARIVQEWADRVLAGQDPHGRFRALLTEPSVASVRNESDHVVRERAFQALARCGDALVPSAVIRAHLREGSAAPTPPSVYGYIREGLLAPTALQECVVFLVPAAGALLSEAASLYNKTVRRSGEGPPALRKSLAAQPAVLAEVVRTGRRFVSSGAKASDLAAYTDSLRQQIHQHSILFQAHGEQPR